MVLQRGLGKQDAGFVEVRSRFARMSRIWKDQRRPEECT